MVARKIGWIQDKIAPPRFLMFLGILAVVFGVLLLRVDWYRAYMTAFDVAAVVFFLSALRLLKLTKPDEMRDHARENDANRVLLMLVTFLVTVAIFVTVAVELNRDKPSVALMLGTLTAAWVFGNAMFAMHYAYAYWIKDGEGGFDFPHTDKPDFADFAYLSYNIGMTFSSSDVSLTARDVRLVVLMHSLAAFIFNIGALAFTVGSLSGSA